MSPDVGKMKIEGKDTGAVAFQEYDAWRSTTLANQRLSKVKEFRSSGDSVPAPALPHSLTLVHPSPRI